MGKKITDKVTWVGKVDWELKDFHGKEFSTRKGSSYNSYLIRDKKTALIDTVWQPYDREFVTRLKQEINLNEIDYIIANHGEIDHSGALPELLREIPGTPVYCTAKGAQIFHVVGEGYRSLWVPDEAEIANCKRFGEDFVKLIQG
ncbi:MAG: flavoprotein [Anaerocolumna sp.]|jgi:flavorubredoxin|nr:flavoprotein [Anaerocolumna sp.]